MEKYESRLGRAEKDIGGVVGETAKAVSERITSGAIERAQSDLDIEGARKKIEGVEGAEPHIVRSASNILEGFGAALEKRGKTILAAAEARDRRAREHERKILGGKEKVIKGEQEMRTDKIGEAVLEAADISRRIFHEGVPESRGEQRVRDLKELWHGFFSGFLNRSAERGRRIGEYYHRAGETIQTFARDLIGSWGEEKGAALGDLEKREKLLREREAELSELEGKLKQAFAQVTEKGPELTRSAREMMRGESAAGQEDISSKGAKKIAEMGEVD